MQEELSGKLRGANAKGHTMSTFQDEFDPEKGKTLRAHCEVCGHSIEATRGGDRWIFQVEPSEDPCTLEQIPFTARPEYRERIAAVSAA